MKALITLFTLFIIIFAKNQENLYINATYDGYEEGFYYFTDEKDNSFFFEGAETAASEIYNLIGKQFIGKTFDITY